MVTETLLSQLGSLNKLINDHKDLTEIMVNPDGRVWIEAAGKVRNSGERLSEDKIYSIIRLLAGIHGLTVSRDNPALSVKLPVFNGGRFQALIPPVVSGPAFSIRFPARRAYTLDDLLEKKTITPKQYTLLEDAVNGRKNIIVAGSTGSGKTTVANALLERIGGEERVIIIEDNPELQASGVNTVIMLTGNNYSLRDAVKASLRLRPDRIIIGEIRDGGTALDLCKAWLTGHPGGIGTIHAGSAAGVKNRILNLMAEEAHRPSSDLVNESIDVIAHISKVFVNGKIERRVTEIIT